MTVSLLSHLSEVFSRYGVGLGVGLDEIMGLGVGVGVGLGVGVGVGGTSLATGDAPGVISRITWPDTAGCEPVRNWTARLTRKTRETTASSELETNIGCWINGRFETAGIGTRPRYMSVVMPPAPTSSKNKASKTGPAYGQGRVLVQTRHIFWAKEGGEPM
jgi:hypothetical protein